MSEFTPRGPRGIILGVRKDGRPIYAIAGGSETVTDIIERLSGDIAAKVAQRKVHSDSIKVVTDAMGREGRSATTPAEDTVIDAARSALTTVDAEIDALVATRGKWEADQVREDAITNLAVGTVDTGVKRGGARTDTKERVYSQLDSIRGERSFFQDAFASTHNSDIDASQRLQRHRREMDVELRDRGLETRALATGGAGSLVIPQYLIDLFAPALRAGRPLANMVTGLPLPSVGMTLTIPRLTTPTSEGVQTSENSPVTSSTPAVTDLVIPVFTVAGQVDVSRQTLERGVGVDELLYMDLAAAYAAQIDNLIINGTGTGGQPTGFLTQAGTFAATAFGAAPTATNFNSKIAGLIGAITGQGAGIRAKLIVLAPRRWAWLTAQVDSSGRPIIPPLANGPYNAVGLNLNPGYLGSDDDPITGAEIVGQIQGIPVTTDANIPTNVGTNLEDVDLVLDHMKALLWEDGDGAPRQLRFEQTTGGSLTTKLVAYGYAAFSAGRYPGATGKVGGLDSTATFGLVAPTF